MVDPGVTHKGRNGTITEGFDGNDAEAVHPSLNSHTLCTALRNKCRVAVFPSLAWSPAKTPQRSTKKHPRVPSSTRSMALSLVGGCDEYDFAYDGLDHSNLAKTIPSLRPSGSMKTLHECVPLVAR